MLSNDEQRQLDEIERALREDDPTFASAVDFGHARRRRVMAPAAIILSGLVLLVVGAIVAESFLVIGVILSVAGFLVAVGGFWWLIRGDHRQVRPG